MDKKVVINKDSNPNEFAGKIFSFINHVSNLEVAEFPSELFWEGPPVKPTRGSK